MISSQVLSSHSNPFPTRRLQLCHIFNSSHTTSKVSQCVLKHCSSLFCNRISRSDPPEQQLLIGGVVRLLAIRQRMPNLDWCNVEQITSLKPTVFQEQHNHNVGISIGFRRPRIPPTRHIKRRIQDRLAPTRIACLSLVLDFGIQKYSQIHLPEHTSSSITPKDETAVQKIIRQADSVALVRGVPRQDC
jgi:hypothetical protein